MSKKNASTNNISLNLRTESNAPTLRAAIESAIKKYNTMLPTVSTETMHSVKVKLDSAKKSISTDIAALNIALAADYYKTTMPVDVLKVGKSVPCVTLTEAKEGGSLSLTDSVTYPTLWGMKDFLPEKMVERCDALRRSAAYIAMEGMEGRKAVLSGGEVTDDNGNKKKVNAPTAGCAEILATWKHSKSELKDNLRLTISLLCGIEQSDLLVSSKLVNDFLTFCITDRGCEWGERKMADQAHVGDKVLEYTHMVLNGKKGFVVKVG